MLKLDRMTVAGFKSFGERADLRFPAGITAIVGPNGCGKSNIGDAINWVLGEQSARLLRGQQMSDVIFSGSEARKPLGMAEVSLHLSGAEALMGGEGDLVITRRLYRSGESEYLLNDQRSRLRDIQELLRQGKVGARTYATIEQGKIDQVLNAKPRDRRGLIEDAAGVSGYKHKRRLAELKLEATQANLLRVNDIVGEVARQIRSLQRQAARARRYRRLRDELRAAERLRFAQRARALEAELSELQVREGVARDAEAEASAQLGRVEAELEERRAACESSQRDHAARSRRLHELELAIDRGQTQIAACRERIREAEEVGARRAEEVGQLAARLDALVERRADQERSVRSGREALVALEAELAERRQASRRAEEERRALREALEELRREQLVTLARAAEARNRLQRVEEALARGISARERTELERAAAHAEAERLHEATSELSAVSLDHAQSRATLEREVAALDRELASRREASEREIERLSAAREREKSAQARLHTLEDVDTRFAGVADGVRSLLASAPRAGIRVRGVVADWLEASREIEGAAEGYLQWLLPAVVVEDDGDASRAAELLRTADTGRTWLLSGTQPAGALAIGTAANGHGELPREVLEDERVLGRLRDRLTLKAGANGVLSERIGDAVLVDRLESALELHRRHPGVDYLTPAGDIVYASGVIATGGGAAQGRGLLAHQRRLREARREMEEAARDLSTLETSAEAARKVVSRLEADVRERRTALEIAERRRVELDLHVARSSEERDRSTRRIEVLTEELAGLAEEQARLTAEIDAARASAVELEGAHEALEATTTAKARALSEREATVASISEHAARVGAEVAAGRQRQEAAETDLVRVVAEHEEIVDRRRALEEQAAEAAERSRAARALAASTETEIAARMDERGALERGLRELERSLAAQQETLAGHEAELRRRRVEMDSLREASRAAEIERTRAEASRAHLDELCRQELGIGAAEVATDVGEGEADVAPEALEERARDLRERIERIGPVNLTAIEEFTELEERHRFLTAQREDLEKSMESLRETIRRINRQSRERFVEAFESIRRSFQEVYRLLFNGGRADLRLEEGEDVLECGIEILAQPPGKRLASVQLLSGGEKALSAIALLFAIFRYQPSPFCLLDEVDAALDDSNVARFARMVREYAANTQFILITHNKLSMEAADLLYGVTMEEPGVSRLMSLEVR